MDLIARLHPPPIPPEVLLGAAHLGELGDRNRFKRLLLHPRSLIPRAWPDAQPYDGHVRFTREAVVTLSTI